MGAAETLERLVDLINDIATYPVHLCQIKRQGAEDLKCEVLELVSEYLEEVSHRLDFSKYLLDAYESGADLQELRDMCSTHQIGEGFGELADEVRELIPGEVGAELAAYIESLDDSTK